MFAHQAQLALLYDSPDNASDFARRALSFPGVVRAEIDHADGRVLLMSPPLGPNEAPPRVRAMPVSNEDNDDPVSMVGETNGAWEFVAPVFINKTAHAPELDVDQRQPVLLGHVRIFQSKELLVQNVRHLLALQIGVLVAVALVMLTYVRRLVSRATAPLVDMTSAMDGISRGGPWTPVPVTGPRDLQHMASIFNGLIATLIEREYDLDQAMYRQGQLLNHLHEAREDQNRTIARDLHDSIGGNLTTLKLRLALLMEDLPDTHPIRQSLAALHVLSHDTLLLTKHITALLRPTMLDTLGLTATLQWLADEFSHTTRVSCKLHLTATCSLTAERNIAVFRIVQEALTNISRHAKCTEVELVTTSDDKHLYVSVWDNGQGFDTSQVTAKTQSYGLLSMRERVLYLGGELQISSSPGSGVKLDIRVPLAANERSAGERCNPTT